MRPFADAVVDYAQAGWPCILPVPAEAKSPPPEGFTGADGRDTTPLDLVGWATTHADWSIALRMPDGVVGIDVDHYDKGKVSKRGNDSLLELIGKWGPLPPTWSSTARGSEAGPGPSRILFFRVPPGRYVTKLGEAIEIIQRHHRYAVVAPSWNHQAGRDYHWHGPDNAPSRMPKVDELPELPAAWVEGLRVGATEAAPVAAETSRGQVMLHAILSADEPECAEVSSAYRQAEAELTAAESGSRHDTATARVHHLIQLGAHGHPGVGRALGRLSYIWIQLTSAENRQDEWHRMMLTSARKAVTAVGRGLPVDRDPCLMMGSVLMAAPAPVDNRPAPAEGEPPLAPLEPIEPPREVHPFEIIGAHEFDPRGMFDQTLGNAVLARTQPVLRYAHDARVWMLRGPEIWDSRPDLAGWAVALLADRMPHGNPDADKGSDEHRRAARRKLFMTASSSRGIATKMRDLVAGGAHPSALRITELDREPWLLWAGGMPWDLRASHERPTTAHLDPATPHRHSAGIAPDTRPTPRWDAFLAAVWPDPELRAWALRVLSVTLTGYSDKVLPIMVGKKDRGKTQVIALLMSVLGTYAHAADPRLLSGADKAHASIIYALMGRRLSFIDEGPREGKVGQEHLKQLTGGGELTGNAMNQNPVTWSPTHTLVLTCNDEPSLTDPAVRSRVRLIPCEGDPEQVIATRAAIGHPGDRTWRTEAPGVLAAMMREAAAWLADPTTALTSAAPEAYRFRAEEIAADQDPIASWLADETQPDETGERSRTLYEAFVTWARVGKPAGWMAPTETRWGRELNDRGYPARHTVTGKRRPLRLRQHGGYLPVAGPTPAQFMTNRTNTNPSASEADPSAKSPDPSGVSKINPPSSPAPDGLDQNSDGLLTGSKTNPSTPDSQVNIHISNNPDGLTGLSNSSNTHAHTHAQEEPGGKTSQPVSGRKIADPQTKIDKAAAKSQRVAEERAARIAQAAGELVPLPAAVNRAGGVFPLSLDEAGSAVRAVLAQAGGLTVDVETTGYPVGHADYALRTIQLGEEDLAVVFAANDQAHRELCAALLDEAPWLEAHSATADLVPLAHAGVVTPAAWERMRDTVITAKLADPASTGSDPALKQLAPAVLGEHAVIPAADAARDALFKAGRWLKEIDPDTPLERSGWAQVDSRCTTMIRYAGGDVLDTAAIRKRLPTLPEEIIDRERAVQRITARIAHDGLPIDGQRVAELTAKHEPARAEAGARVCAWGIENPGSDQQIAKVLTTMGAPLPRTKPSKKFPHGQPSVAVAALTPLKGDQGPVGELVRAVLDYRHHDTVLGTFLRPYRELVVRGDGRVRPTVYTLGADTGRMCLPTTHGLVTPNGVVSADRVLPGMTTLDADGRWVSVLAVHRYGDAPVETLSNRGVELAATPEHRWMTTREHEAEYARKTGRLAPPRALRRLSDHPRLRVHLAPDVESFDFAARTIPAETDAQRFAAMIGMLVTDGRCTDSDVPGVGLRAYVYQTEDKFYAEFLRVIPDDAVMYDRLTHMAPGQVGHHRVPPDDAVTYDRSTRYGKRHHEIRIRARWLRPRLEVAGLTVGALLKDSGGLYGWVAGLPIDELRAFFAACWLADGTLCQRNMACGSEKLRAALTLAAYRLGFVAYTVNYGRGGWSTRDRFGLRFREPVITTHRSEKGQGRADVWCVTTETGTFTAHAPTGTTYLTGNSCVRPNLQQLPREGGVRACITADPGHLLVSADFSAVEVRVMAALSQDPDLIRILYEGADLHAIVAAQAFGPEWTKADRYTSKRGVFGWAYGGSVPSLAAQVGVSQSVMAAVVDSLRLVAPRYVAWVDELKRAVRRGATQMPTYAGRVIHLDRHYPHKAANYCLGMNTPILRSDLQHVAASKIQVGDRLVAFDEYPQDGTGGQNKYHHLRTAVVEAVSTVVKPSVRVRTADGKATECSTDHLWLVRPLKGRKNNRPRVRWVRADELQPGDDLLSLGTWDVAYGRTAGYLAGLYDGEGSLRRHTGGRRNNQLFFSQNRGPVMEAFRASMDELELPYSYYDRAPNSTSPTDGVVVSGLRNVLRTLGTLQPARFRPRFEGLYEGNAITAGLTESVPVVAVEHAGAMELVSIQTSTRTLVANGFLSHNCVQGTARELLCDALINWSQTRWGDSIVVPVHDEIIAMVPEAEAEQATAALVQCMTTSLYGVPIVAEADSPSFAWQDAV